jgi:4-oxalocrotonate tautomerase
MPFVHIRITKDGVTAENKRKVIAGITRVLQEEMGKEPKWTTVVIDEIDDDNWGLEGQSVSERKLIS